MDKFTYFMSISEYVDKDNIKNEFNHGKRRSHGSIETKFNKIVWH